MEPQCFNRLFEDAGDSEVPEEYTIRGEYWISRDGDVEFADGDIGDLNHEGIVIRTVMSKIADMVAMDTDDDFDWDMLVHFVFKDLFDDDDSVPNIKVGGKYPEPIMRRIMAKLLQASRAAFGNPRAARDAIQIAQGRGDAREFAMEHFGDKWCRGNDIASWTLTREDVGAIIAGVGNIVYEETGDSADLVTVPLSIRSVKGGSYEATLQELESRELGHRTPEAYSNPLSATNQLKQIDVDDMHPNYRGKVGD
jgi:hypothetical protein